MTRLPVLVSNQPAGQCRPNDFPVSAEITLFHTGMGFLGEHCLAKIAAGLDVVGVSQVGRTVVPQFLLGVISHLAKRAVRLPEFLIQPDYGHADWSFLKNLPKILFAGF